MISPKELLVRPVAPRNANRIVRELHYSRKVAVTSRLHLGVFHGERCGGILQFGDSIDKRKILGLVPGTGWREYLELNRMAFAEWLPRNSESRCLAWSLRWIRKTYPHIRWIVSFADATQCGDGTIYRASGFVLTGIRENRTMWRLPSGEVIADIITRQAWNESTRNRLGFRIGEKWSDYSRRVGAVRLAGFQLRYMYFLDPESRHRLSVPIIPFSEIARRGATMYRGKPRAGSADSGTTDFQSGRGGATPTPALSQNHGADDAAV